MTISLFVVTVVSQILLGCYDDRYGTHGITSDSEESKKRGVWVCDYTLTDSMLVISPTIHLTVKEAYLERRWRYGKESLSETTVNPEDGYWFIVKFTDDANLRYMTFTWTIGSSWKNSFRTTNKHSIVLELKEVPVGNYASFPIVVGDVGKMNGKRVEIGEMTLKRN